MDKSELNINNNIYNTIQEEVKKIKNNMTRLEKIILNNANKIDSVTKLLERLLNRNG